jgi:hypothetical protein
MKKRSTIRSFGVAFLMLIQAAVPCSAIGQTGSGSQAPAGLVNSVTGNAYARSASGKETLLKAGDVFGPGTTFRTGSDSNVVLLFADGQNIALAKDSELHIDAYRFDARDAKSNGATLGLASGMMRFVTGAIHAQNQDALFISAGKVSVDILSKDVTAFVVEADPKAAGVGELAVIVGEVAIQTPVGPLTIVAADQFTRWRIGAAPSAPAPLAAAPAVFQAAVAASRAFIAGSNAPVDIQSAAVQAALAELPATGAGPAQPQTQAQGAESAVAVITPAVTSGGGRGCVGSPC